jgi:hypothetical protein
MARTAVVAGTATAVSNRVSRRQAGRWAQQDAQQYQEPPQQYQEPPPQYQQPPPAPAAPDTGNMIEQLKQLGELKEAGVLTEAEFAVQKSKILGS